MTKKDLQDFLYKDIKSRKLSSDIECPVDDILYNHIIDPSYKLTNSLGLTPNDITTFSVLFGSVAVYFLYKKEFLLFSISFILYYICDVLDGYTARKNKQCSKLGDYYDHVTDFITFIPIILIIFWRLYNKKLYIHIVVFLIFLFMFNLHMSCQELHIQDTIPEDSECHSETLGLIKICKDKETIKLSRHFGMGTLIVFIVYISYFVCRI